MEREQMTTVTYRNQYYICSNRLSILRSPCYRNSGADELLHSILIRRDERVLAFLIDKCISEEAFLRAHSLGER